MGPAGRVSSNFWRTRGPSVFGTIQLLWLDVTSCWARHLITGVHHRSCCQNVGQPCTKISKPWAAKLRQDQHGALLDLLAGFEESRGNRRGVWKVWLKQGREGENERDRHLSHTRSPPTFQPWLCLWSYHRITAKAELSMGPFCVTRSNPTHQLTDPNQPTTSGKFWTHHDPTQYD